MGALAGITICRFCAPVPEIVLLAARLIALHRLRSRSSCLAARVQGPVIPVFIFFMGLVCE